MPRISAARAKERHESLLVAARKVFTAKGYERAGISEIARAAKISDGLLYHYFGSKRNLFFTVLETFYARIIADLEAAVSRASGFDQRLNALIREHVAVFVSDVDLCRLFISEVRNFDEYPDSEAQELNRRYTAVFVRIFTEGVREGRVSRDFDVRLVRDMLFGGIEHIAWRHISAGVPLDVARVAGQVSRLVLTGIGSA